MKTVLFACIHNAGRSQMAAAWFDALADPARARAVSAGTEPGARVHPEVLEAMHEVGIDLASIVAAAAHATRWRRREPARHDGLRRGVPRRARARAARLAVRGSEGQGHGNGSPDSGRHP